MDVRGDGLGGRWAEGNGAVYVYRGYGEEGCAQPGADASAGISVFALGLILRQRSRANPYDPAMHAPMNRALALQAALLLAPGCGTKCIDTGAGCVTDADADTDTDADSDTDSDTHADTDADVEDTATFLFYAGDAHTDAGVFVGGHFGWLVTDDDLSALCTDESTWSETADPAPTCAQCEWAFNLTLSGGIASGAECDRLGLDGTEWDGFTGSFGFASSYDYDYSGTIYTLDLVVFYYTEGYGWGPLSYNYAGDGYNVGDALDITFAQSFSYLYTNE